MAKNSSITNANKIGQGNVNVPTLRFPEFTDEWKECKLSKCCIFAKGCGISKENLSKHGKPCILYGELYTTYKTAIARLIKSKTALSPDGLFHSKKNDVIIPCSGETAEDIATSVSIPYDDILLGGDLTVIRSNLDGAFLSNQLNGVRKFDIARIAQGKSIVHLQANELKNIEISFPSISEQKKISGFIDLLDHRIEVQNKIIEKYKSLIKGITDALVDETATVVLFSKLYDKAGEGGTPATSSPQYYENGTIPFIKIDDLSGKYITRNSDHITSVGLNNSSAWMIPSNSVIYSNGATIGRISITTYPVVTKQGVLGIIPSSLITSEYMYYFLSSKYFRKQVCRITVKGTMECAYLKDLNAIKCHIPTKEKQNGITTLLSVIDAMIRNEKDILTKLITQKKYMLYSLFI